MPGEVVLSFLGAELPRMNQWSNSIFAIQRLFAFKMAQSLKCMWRELSGFLLCGYSEKGELYESKLVHTGNAE